MLEEIRIRNFAIIDQLELDFAPGFNVITGETGAGKSIIIDAVELLLGSKADSSAIRAGADRAIIEGVFALSEKERALITPILEREDLMVETESRFITLTREIRSSGRSSARVNGVTVNADLLREIGDELIDIHGQSAHLSLFKPRTHIDLLDRYAHILELRDEMATKVHKLNTMRAEIRGLQEDKEALQRRADRLRYEVDEIEAADLEADEEADLIAERNRLANSEQLATLAAESLALLNGEESDDQTPVLDGLMQIATGLSKLARIDPEMSDDAELADGISAQAQELAITLGGYLDEIEYDPDRLNELEERLELIKNLKRRYRVETIAGILAYAETAAKELEGIENSEERLNELREAERKALHSIGETAQKLSKMREIAGKNLAKRVMSELADLRMENTRFEAQPIQIEDPHGCFVGEKRYRFDHTGMDQLEFMMSANPGQPLRPLAKVASGGEAARIMLALKRVLSQVDHTPTLIFDEIDQGIGGRIGSVVGEKLWTLSDEHQVLVVTHLPQLAGFGDRHYQVRKAITEGRTATIVSALEEDERIAELAAMLGAQGEAGRQSALGLLMEAQAFKHDMHKAQRKLL